MNRVAFRGWFWRRPLSAKTEADGGKGRGGICADIPRNVGGLVGRDLTAGAEKYVSAKAGVDCIGVDCVVYLWPSGIAGLKIAAQIAGELCYNTCALGD